jgi:hypothetical protein
MQSRGDQTGRMRDVGHQRGPDLIGDLTEWLEVDRPREGRAAGDDHPRSVRAREIVHLVQIDQLRVAAHAVRDDLVEPSREVHRTAGCEMAAVRQARREHGVARLQQRKVDGHVRLRARVGLHVDVLGAEQFLGPRDGQLLGDVDHLAPAVVPPARIAFGVLVGEDGSDGFQHRLGDEVFRGDQLEVAGLPFRLAGDRRSDLGIDALKPAHDARNPAPAPHDGARGP